jgi:hypothetical protein
LGGPIALTRTAQFTLHTDLLVALSRSIIPCVYLPNFASGCISRLPTSHKVFLGIDFILIPLSTFPHLTAIVSSLCTTLQLTVVASAAMKENVPPSSQEQTADEVFHPELHPGARIRFGSLDEEAGRPQSVSAGPTRRLSRTAKQLSVKRKKTRLH